MAMKTVTIQVPDWNHTLPRVVALCLAVAGLGVATWYGTRPQPIDDGNSFVENTQATPPNDYDYQTQPVAYRERSTAGEGACNQWDISPVAMEAVLQEMIRRGWKPPTQGEAIASIEPSTGPKVISLDPNAPVGVTPRTLPPVTTELPEEGVVTDGTAPIGTTPTTAPTGTTPTGTTPTTRPPSVVRPPAATPPVATSPRTTPPVATPRPPAAQPPAAPRPAPAPTPAPVTPPVAAPPAAPAIPPAAPPAPAPSEPAAAADPA